MRVGVLDSDGKFNNRFFKDMNLKIIRNGKHFFKREKTEQTEQLTHAEYVCSHIFKENQNAQIILIPIIKDNLKCSVQDMIDGIELLIKCQVDIINLSIGDEFKYHSEIEEVCYKAHKLGILIVAAHSNKIVTATYPADFPFVLGVNCIEKEGSKTIFKYDENRNEITFSSNYISNYQLGIPLLLRGNSFICAKINGILSHCKNDYKNYLKKLEDSILNKYYPYERLKQKRCLFYTNRKSEHWEQTFIVDVTNTVKCVNVQHKFELEKMNKDGWDILFIDHNNYTKILPYKNVLYEYAVQNPDKEVVLRYPLFGLQERMTLYEKKSVVIHQFFI